MLCKCPLCPSVFQLSGVEVRLSALEARIEKLLSGLDRIKVLEKRLEELERLRNTDKVDKIISPHQYNMKLYIICLLF